MTTKSKITLMSVADLLNEPDPRHWTVEDGYISTMAGGYPYDIELIRCNTPAKILGWVRHLAKKNWATSGVLLGFIETASHAAGVDCYANG
jgi:hypothetical protein